MAEGQSLRQVLAELDMRVRGLGQVDEANVAIDRYVRSTQPAATQTEKLRVEQQQAYETASRLGRQIRKLQKAEGDHERQIRELRLAMARAKDSAKDYGRQIRELEGDTKAAATTTGGTGRTGLIGSMRGAAGVITGVVASVTAAVGSIRLMTGAMRDTIETATELDVTAQAIGLTTDALQEWQFIAERVGIDQRDMRQGFGDLANEAQEGAEEFRRLGIDTKASNGELKDMNTLMEETLVAMGGMDNDTERLSMAMKVFGEDAGASFATLAKNADSIDELRARVRELGGGLSEEAVDKSVEAADAMQEWRLAMRSLKSTLVAEVLPPLARLASSVATFVGQAVEVIRNSNIMKATLGVLAAAFTALAVAMLPVLGPLALSVALWTGLALVIDDVITAFKGGDSVIGDWAESLLEAMGIGFTFTGALEAISLGWDKTKARVLNAIAEILAGVARLQKGLGIEVFSGLNEAAVSARQRANDANVAVARGAENLAERERERRVARATSAAARLVMGDIDAASEINIYEATDAEGMRRVIRELDREKLRKVADQMPFIPSDLISAEAEGGG